MEKIRFFDEPSSEGSFATLGKLFKRISAAGLGVCGWYLALLYVALLLVEALARSFGVAGTYTMGFALLGTAAMLLAVLWSGKRLLDRDHCLRVLWTMTDMALLLMLCWCCVSTMFSEDPAAAFIGSDYRQEGLFAYLIYGSLYFCCRQIRQESRTRRLIWGLCLAGTVLSVWAMLFASVLGEAAEAKFGPVEAWYNSVGAIFFNPNHFAYFLSMSIMAAGGLFVTERIGWRRALAAAAYVIQTLMLLHNATLGGYLAVWAGLALLLILTLVRRDGNAVWVLSLVAVLAVFTLFQRCDGYDVAGDMQLAIDAFDTVEEVNAADQQELEEIATSSGVDRLMMWKQALTYTVRRPLVGFGPDGSGRIHFDDTVAGSDRPHNEYLQYAVYFGVPGALLYLTALISLFAGCIRRIKTLSTTGMILGGMVFAYCASAFVGNSMYYTTVYFFMILALLVNESTRDERK